MFLLVRLLRPWLGRASGRSIVALLAALGVGAAVLVAVGLTAHDRVAIRLGIGLIVVAALTARIAWRSRGASSRV